MTMTKMTTTISSGRMKFQLRVILPGLDLNMESTINKIYERWIYRDDVRAGEDTRQSSYGTE